MPRIRIVHGLTALLCAIGASQLHAADADLILRGGKIVTVDADFSIKSAVAIAGGRIVAVGSDEEIGKLKGPNTKVVDLGGKTVLPGLIDSHTHPTGACMTEYDHPIPDMATVRDVLDYIGHRARELGPGKWVVVRQVFITRLKEQRYPTRAEMDQVAPENPVLFSTGPDASINTLAMKLSGIDKDFKIDGPGKIEKDPATGEPTGILRNCTRYVKVKSSEKSATKEEETKRFIELVADYNSVGITGIIDRNASSGSIEMYRRLRDEGKLGVRMALSHAVDNLGPVDKIVENIKKVGKHPLRAEDPRLRIVGIKMFLDGGMLTGSSYMREPWGVSKIYSIDDPTYKGVLFISPDRLTPIVRATVEQGLQYTAHSVGDGAVHTLLAAYEEVNKSLPVAATRPCLTHSNFMSAEAIAIAAKLGVVVDIQPAWLYLDTRTLHAQFGYDRLRWFQPLHSLFAAGVTVGGGSDHMQKIGSFRSINPYNPFLGMATAIGRKARGYEGRLHPEEALTRSEAIRFYTINNAKLMFLEKETGSIEPGKRADLVVIDRDLLTCPEEEIAGTQALSTYLDGKPVFERK